MTEGEAKLAALMGIIDEQTMRPFTPFSDANHDYEVLEWIRSQPHYDYKNDRWNAIKLAKDELFNRGRRLNYEIGDYARAAFRAFNITEFCDQPEQK